MRISVLARILVVNLLAVGGIVSLYGESRAVRPDAPQLGSSLFGPEMACNIPAICCPDNAATRGCSPTIISETGFAQTLTIAGTYCLGTDLVSPLTIAGNSITLDMNGHTIFVPAGANGITITGVTQLNDIRVFGGLLDGQGAGANNGIYITNAVDVRIEHVTAINCDFGIYLAGAGSSSGGMILSPINTVIDNVECNGNTLAGLFCQGDFNTAVNDGAFGENGFGIIAEESESLVVSRCTASENTIGFEIEISSASELRNCVSTNNSDVGYEINGSFAIILRDCDASTNETVGFLITNSSTDISLFNCAAEGNSLDGFSVGDGSEALIIDSNATGNGGNGFSLQSPSVVMVRGSTATNNGAIGFDNDVPANQFYSNAACNNTLANYDGVVAAPVASPAAADGVDNVDCSIANTSCEATPIYNTGVTQILVNSGRYCLAEDITAAAATNVLTISGSSIFIDLNGHTINVPAGGTGITVSAGFTDIRIYNGFINGNGVGLFGIFADACIDLRVEDITCENLLVQGISLIGTLRALVSRVSANTSESGILCAGDDGTVITNSRFSNHTLNGVGFGASSVNGVIRDCIADNNANGFNIRQSTQIELYNCVAESNTAIGFIMFTSTGLLDHCVAEYNDSDGFGMQTTSDVMVKDCVATHNTGFGFNNAVASNQFYRNFSCDNTAGNYSGVTSAPVAGPASADGVDNVDCSIANVSCEATPIFNTGVTQILVNSGRYCLAQDITVAAGNVLSITGSSIFVDLNGHRITTPAGGSGVSIAALATDVRVYNGFINGNGVGTSGVSIAAALDVRLEDLTIENFTGQSAIALAGSIRTIINRVSSNTSANGLLVGTSSSGTQIIDSRFSNNTGSGILFNGTSVNSVVRGCKADINATGFSMVGSSRTELFECTAQTNTADGFVVANALALLENCVSEYNVSDGFDLQAGSDVMVTGCVATHNTGFGFNNGVAANQFYSNEACDNTAGNYSGVTSSAVAGPLGATGVNNVDCTITGHCSPTMIYNTNATQVLVTSGVYCLAENITAAAGTVLQINGTSIFVDLNGHTITIPANGAGISMNGPDGRVFNGVIDGQSAVSTEGIIMGSFNNQVEDMVIVNCVDYAFLVGGTNMTISRSLCDNCGIGIFCNGATNLVVRDCIATRSATDGLQCNNVNNNIVIYSSQFNRNTSYGVRVIGTSTVEIWDCTMDNNGIDGLLVGAGCSAVVYDSFARLNAGNGFTVGALNTNCILRRCVAELNTGSGFSITGATTQAIVRECTAHRNTGFGIADGGTTSVYYTNNAWQNTAGDFSGLPVTMVALVAATAGYWQNVNTAL